MRKPRPALPWSRVVYARSRGRKSRSYSGSSRDKDKEEAPCQDRSSNSPLFRSWQEIKGGISPAPNWAPQAQGQFCILIQPFATFPPSSPMPSPCRFVNTFGVLQLSVLKRSRLSFLNHLFLRRKAQLWNKWLQDCCQGLCCLNVLL